MDEKGVIIPVLINELNRSRILAGHRRKSVWNTESMQIIRNGMRWQVATDHAC